MEVSEEVRRDSERSRDLDNEGRRRQEEMGPPMYSTNVYIDKGFFRSLKYLIKG